jgi:hypothetical protein
VAQEDWPQFRGPDGLAVATNATLPASLDPASPGLRWKVRVPGTGISSPIVSKGQVFLTTAYEGQELSRTRRYTTLGMLVLGVLALLAIAGQLLRRFAAGPTSGLAKLLSRLDVLAALLATIGFVGIAAVAALDPQQLWARGIPGDTWLVTGTAGLVGLFAAGGWLRLHSIGRLLAGVVLLGVALYLYLGLPLNKHHQVYSIVYRAALVAPGVLGAVWHLLMFSVFRQRGSSSGTRLCSWRRRNACIARTRSPHHRLAWPWTVNGSLRSSGPVGPASIAMARRSGKAVTTATWSSPTTAR